MGQPLTKLGIRTPKVVIYKSESHKLCQAFPVKDGDIIYSGAPVKLNTNGTISPYFGSGTYIGIAQNFGDGSPYPATAAGKELTVMVEGFTILYGLSKGAFEAGGVKPASASTTSAYTEYGADAVNPNPKFIALNSATAAGELVQILVK